MTPPQARILADSGELSTQPLPELLIELSLQKFDGSLLLRRDRYERRFVLQAGCALHSESNLASEALGNYLLADRMISQEDYRRIQEFCSQQDCGESLALLRLDLVDPKTLLLQVKAQLKRALVDCFGWLDGDFELRDDPRPSEDLEPLRSSLLPLVQEGLDAHWSIERMLQSLSTSLDLYPRPRSGLPHLVAQLAMTPDQRAHLLALDGRRPLRMAMGTSALASRQGLAALWVLDAAGAFDLLTKPRPSDSEKAQEFEFEFEGSTKEMAGSSETPALSSARELATAETEHGDVRSRILQRSAHLDRFDLYELLEVDPKARGRVLKKAYISAAKSYHPDTLARLGLQDLKEEAAKIFSRVSQAYETLSNTDKRRDYDASLRGEVTDSDAQTISQAESAYRKGEILMKMGDFARARDYMEAAVRLWPTEGVYLSALGWSTYKNSLADAEPARDSLRKAVELLPQDSLAHFRLALVLRTLGDDEEADRLLDVSKSLGIEDEPPQ